MRLWLWHVGDWVSSLGTLLQDEIPLDNSESRWWELTAGVYATQAEADQMLDDLMEVLCGGYDDGGHHVCMRDVVASVGPSAAVHSTSTASVAYNWDRTDSTVDDNS